MEWNDHDWFNFLYVLTWLNSMTWYILLHQNQKGVILWNTLHNMQKNSNVHFFPTINLFPVLAHLLWMSSYKLGYHISFLDCPVHGMRDFVQMWEKMWKLLSLPTLVLFSHELLFVFFFFFSLSLGISKSYHLNHIIYLHFASTLKLFCSLLWLIGIKYCWGRMWISCSLWHYTEFKTWRILLSLWHVSCLLPNWLV